ncbi:transcriptional regulator family: Fungal Specific TF [Penicillium daleae]|uniref:Transcriptional regulator family: Fungal Specific TF n=1 Tax=Penicillium daleae TaxID=63821 RepID=A0AAD6FWG3_9EURO|nr:transcriptional regulator family: Fungal Specific TF [Penicillium daleae]KAJ5432841.1 transcriptional regulator family: Fungal Specific TF [Penicillium daleae]
MFQCSQCDKAYQRKTHLLRHETTQTVGRSISCQAKKALLNPKREVTRRHSKICAKKKISRCLLQLDLAGSGCLVRHVSQQKQLAIEASHAPVASPLGGHAASKYLLTLLALHSSLLQRPLHH